VDSASLITSLLCPTLLLIAFCYAALCAASPFGTCRHCAGTGRRRGERSRSRRPCRRCDATGIRIRYGRHLWNVAARIHRDGAR
jgi:hypothetical protein